MSHDTRKRDPKRSNPQMLAIRMDAAKAEHKPMDMEYDEVTGVIDVALERARAVREAGIRSVREFADTLNPPKREPA